MATVIIPTPLRKFTQQQSRVQVKGNSLQEALEELTRNYPDLRKNLLDENGKLRNFVNVFVGEEDVRNLQNELTPLQEESVISIVPAIAGGNIV
ncbi:MAG: MoaD/ThiS family protein [Chitinophagales bacterium]|nr:MoaD/ThiS family protein [Chitinophagales bacterium]MDW8419513.1 MoaD/ThiS family protein [Chitinophagales bacterium]